MRRVALVLVAAMVLGTIVASPAYAGKDNKAKKAAKITVCKKDKNLADNIGKAFDQFLDSGAATAQKMQFIQNGTKIAPFVEEGAQEAAARGQTNTTTTNAAVEIVAECTGKTEATFTYDLAIGLPRPVTSKPAQGVGLSQTGDAVLDKKSGTWLITAATICDLIALGNADRGSRCLAAS